MAPVDALQARLTAADKQRAALGKVQRRMKQVSRRPIQIEGFQAGGDLGAVCCDDRMDTTASERGMGGVITKDQSGETNIMIILLCGRLLIQYPAPRHQSYLLFHLSEESNRLI